MAKTPPLLGAEQQPYLGLAEIGALAGVEDGTTWRWQQRGILPAPDFLISGRTPAWERSRIIAWLTRTGRLQGPPGQPAETEREPAASSAQ